jgi:DNA-nicking Smr family endonuclease
MCPCTRLSPQSSALSTLSIVIECAGVSDDEIEIPIEDTLDLHPFRPKETKDVALSYLEEARRLGFRQVRLIHGRGIGVQREIIRALLVSLPWVEAFHDADHTGGGWGATVVLLLPPEETPLT